MRPQEKSRYLLALHSCTDSLGVAFLDIQDPTEKINSQVFDLGRSLSNKLISSVQEIFPNKLWPQLNRIAVAIGPGGFTSTRLTVVMARSIAQQLDCDLDGISSFELMAPRLSLKLSKENIDQPFWIVKNLHRRGVIGGCYQLKNQSNHSQTNNYIEIKSPYLIPPELKLENRIQAEDNIHLDVNHLLNLSLKRKKSNYKSKWSEVMPIYPTSPVSNT